MLKMMRKLTMVSMQIYKKNDIHTLHPVAAHREGGIVNGVGFGISRTAITVGTLFLKNLLKYPFMSIHSASIL